MECRCVEQSFYVMVSDVGSPVESRRVQEDRNADVALELGHFRKLPHFPREMIP